MDKLGIQTLEVALRDRVGRLVGEKSFLRSHPVYGVFNRIREYRRNAFLCGGACRDMVLRGARAIPRDLDIVVQHVSTTDLAQELGGYAKDRTRFGGFSVEVHDWEVDIWPLSETWAFKHTSVSGNGLNDFTKTTFLDIDAIAVQLFTQRGQKRRVYSNGFFEAVQNRRIEINFEENPYPAKCVVKSVMLAAKYNFALGPKLARYMEYHLSRADLDQLAETARIRYASPSLNASTIDGWLKNIRQQLRLGNRQHIWLEKDAPKSECTERYLI